VGNTQRLPSLPEVAGFLHCRKALRFFGIAGWRFAFPPLPDGAFGLSGLRLGFIVRRVEKP